MSDELDVLASAIHDAKNQLFFAETACAELARKLSASTTHPTNPLAEDLVPIRGSIEQAGNRLERALSYYRVMRDGVSLGITPVAVAAIVEDGVAACGAQLRQLGITVDVKCEVNQIWPLDRDLVVDMLTNAMQNAARHARDQVRVGARLVDDMLAITVEDDGPGFSTLDVKEIHSRGVGLFVAQRIAYLHVRKDRHGSVQLYNGGELGGAGFELRLP